MNNRQKESEIESRLCLKKKRGRPKELDSRRAIKTVRMSDREFGYIRIRSNQLGISDSEYIRKLVHDDMNNQIYEYDEYTYDKNIADFE